MGGSYWVKERVEWNWSALLHALLPTFATAYIRYCCCLHTPPPLLPTSFASRCVLCRGACGGDVPNEEQTKKPGAYGEVQSASKACGAYAALPRITSQALLEWPERVPTIFISFDIGFCKSTSSA